MKTTKQFESFGQRLRRLRTMAQLTQDELGERAGVNWNTIARWERDEMTPNVAKLKTLALALRVEITDLF